MLTLYIGSYSVRTAAGHSRGIYRYGLDEASGALTALGGVDDGFNPSYLALSGDGRRLFAADEVEGRALVSAYAIDPGGDPRFIGRACFPGGDLCNVNLSPDGWFLFGANYGGGNVLSVRVEGGALELISNRVHQGSSVDPERQTKPYAHCAVPDPAGRFVVACDLGADKLFVYALDASGGALTPAHEVDVPAGEGPRHLVFDRAGRRAFAITELGNNVIRYDYAPDTGVLIQRQIVPALPEGSSHHSAGADIQLAPDESRLFASCRDYDFTGNDAIARYRFDGERLVPDGFIKTGKIPRGFALSPGGRLLIAACQESNALQVFDAFTGGLLCEATVPAPVCVKVWGPA